MSILDSKKDEIRALCERHFVKELYAFGSVVTDKFNDSSDIDLIVDFESISLDTYADNYFDLKFSLEELLKRNVDLLENQAIKNPYFKKSVDASKSLIYG